VTGCQDSKEIWMMGMIGVCWCGLNRRSIALGAQKAGFSVTVYDQYNSATGLNLGAANLWAATIEEVALASDLIFIATPISATVFRGRSTVDPSQAPVPLCRRWLAQNRRSRLSFPDYCLPAANTFQLIPWAGSERSGWEAAHAELFREL